METKQLTLTNEQKQISTNNTNRRKTPTLKYNVKKNNIDQQHAKTVDIVRLKTGK